MNKIITHILWIMHYKKEILIFNQYDVTITLLVHCEQWPMFEVNWKTMQWFKQIIFFLLEKNEDLSIRYISLRTYSPSLGTYHYIPTHLKMRLHTHPPEDLTIWYISLHTHPPDNHFVRIDTKRRRRRMERNLRQPVPDLVDKPQYTPISRQTLFCDSGNFSAHALAANTPYMERVMSICFKISFGYMYFAC